MSDIEAPGIIRIIGTFRPIVYSLRTGSAPCCDSMRRLRAYLETDPRGGTLLRIDLVDIISLNETIETVQYCPFCGKEQS